MRAKAFLSSARTRGKRIAARRHDTVVAVNMIVDRVAKPVTCAELQTLKNCRVGVMNVATDDYWNWLQKYFPSYSTKYGDPYFKKLIEFYVSFTLLNPQPTDAMLDAAGGYETYLHLMDCTEKYMQDIVITENIRRHVGAGIHFLECDVSHVPLPDGCLDKISCHHSVEHFQGNSDTRYVCEVQRLLKPKGACCILPVFIADQYVELTDEFTFERHYDARSRCLIDPTASLPGGKNSGNYARIYDLQAFQERVLNAIDERLFKVDIIEIKFDGKNVPDLDLECHRHVCRINYPYRALLITRIK